MKNTFNLLKRTRKSQRISVDTLSKAVDYTRASVYRYENNEFKSIAFDTLCQIAVYLGVHIDELLTALHADGYESGDLDTISTIYKEAYEKRHGEIPHFKMDTPDHDALSEEVDAVLHNEARLALNKIYDRFTSGHISFDHIDLIEYCTSDLDDDQAAKALKLLKVVFNE